jgi:hypothetical protein
VRWRRDSTWDRLLAHAQTKSDVVGEVEWTVSVALRSPGLSMAASPALIASDGDFKSPSNHIQKHQHHSHDRQSPASAAVTWRCSVSPVRSATRSMTLARRQVELGQDAAYLVLTCQMGLVPTQQLVIE